MPLFVDLSAGGNAWFLSSTLRIRCRDTIIGGPFLRRVSGGERKRVSIGHEILVDPSLLFLDEPTSRLDSTTALRIIQVIRKIARVSKSPSNPDMWCLGLCLINFGAQMYILFITKVKILVLNMWSNRSPAIMFIFKPRMVSMYWACFESMSKLSWSTCLCGVRS